PSGGSIQGSGRGPNFVGAPSSRPRYRKRNISRRLLASSLRQKVAQGEVRLPWERGPTLSVERRLRALRLSRVFCEAIRPGGQRPGAFLLPQQSTLARTLRVIDRAARARQAPSGWLM